MSVTIRISDEVASYIRAFGNFGDSHDDVLRRQLKEFEATVRKIKEEREGT